MSYERKNNPIVALIVIPLVGYVLLLIAFLLTAIIRMGLARLFFMGDSEPAAWMPRFFHIGTALLFLLLSFLVLRMKNLKPLYKATFSVVPTAVLLVYTGMFLYNWPTVVYIISGLIVISILLYLYKTKRSWMFYYAIGLVSITLLYMQINGIDI